MPAAIEPLDRVTLRAVRNTGEAIRTAANVAACRAFSDRTTALIHGRKSGFDAPHPPYS
jgi:hypothetical protein